MGDLGMWKAGFPAEAAQARGNFKSGRKRTKPRGNPLEERLNRWKRRAVRGLNTALALSFLLSPAQLTINERFPLTPVISQQVLEAKTPAKSQQSSSKKSLIVYKAEQIVDKSGSLYSRDGGKNLRITGQLQVYRYVIPVIRGKVVLGEENFDRAPLPTFATEFPGLGGAWIVTWYLGFPEGAFVMFNPQTYKQLLSQGKRVGNVIINTGASAYNLGYETYKQWRVSGIHPKSPPEINLTEESLNQLMEKIRSGEENITFGEIPIKRVKENLEEAFKEDFETARKIENALRTEQGWEDRGQSGNYTFTKRVEVVIPPELRQRIIEDLRRIARIAENYIGKERSLFAKWRRDERAMRAMAEWVNSDYAPPEAQNPLLFDGSPWRTTIDVTGGWILVEGQQSIMDALDQVFGGFPMSYTIQANQRYDLLIYIERGDYDEDGTPLIRLAMGMVDKETGFEHLIDETFVRIDRIDEFTQALERYLGAAVLEVDVQGDSTFQSLFVRVPAFDEDGRLDIFQYQIPIKPAPEKHPFMPVATMIVEEELVGNQLRIEGVCGLDSWGVYMGNMMRIDDERGVILLGNGVGVGLGEKRRKEGIKFKRPFEQLKFVLLSAVR